MSSLRAGYVRYAEVADLPAIDALYRTCFCDAAHPPVSHFASAYFGDPDSSKGWGSLVYVRKEKVVAFIGVSRRKFVFGKRNLQAAVTTKLMVDPRERNSIVVLALFKRFLSGPQDFSYADLANDTARSVWLATGGETALLYSLNWTYRPNRSFMEFGRKLSRQIKQKDVPKVSSSGILVHSVQTAYCRDIDFQQISSHQQITTSALRLSPIYTPESLQWRFSRIKENHPKGEIELRGVYDAQDQYIGWFAYHRRPNGQVFTLELKARPDFEETLFDSYLNDANNKGTKVVFGWLQPELLESMRRHARLTIRPSGYWTMVHTRDKTLLATILRGGACFSPLDGEWPLAYEN